MTLDPQRLEVPWIQLDAHRYTIKPRYQPEKNPRVDIKDHNALEDSADRNGVDLDVDFTNIDEVNALPDGAVLSDKQVAEMLVNAYDCTLPLVTKKILSKKFLHNFDQRGHPKVNRFPTGEAGLVKYNGETYVACLLAYRACPGNLDRDIHVGIKVPNWYGARAAGSNPPLVSLVGPVSLPQNHQSHSFLDLPEWAFSRICDIDRGYGPGFGGNGRRLLNPDEVDTPLPKSPKPESPSLASNESRSPGSSCPESPTPDKSGPKGARFTPINGPWPNAKANRISPPKDPEGEEQLDEMDIDSVQPPDAKPPKHSTPSSKDPTSSYYGDWLDDRYLEVMQLDFEIAEYCIEKLLPLLPATHHRRVLAPIEFPEFINLEIPTKLKLAESAADNCAQCLTSMIKDGKVAFEARLNLALEEADLSDVPECELALWFFGQRSGEWLYIPADKTRQLVRSSEWRVESAGKLEPTEDNKAVSVLEWEELDSAEKRGVAYQSLVRLVREASKRES